MAKSQKLHVLIMCRHTVLEKNTFQECHLSILVIMHIVRRYYTRQDFTLSVIPKNVSDIREMTFHAITYATTYRCLNHRDHY